MFDGKSVLLVACFAFRIIIWFTMETRCKSWSDQLQLHLQHWIGCIEIKIWCFICLVKWNQKDIQNFINCTYDIANGKIHIIKAQSDGKCDTENVTQLILIGSISNGGGWNAKEYSKACDANQLFPFIVIHFACDFITVKMQLIFASTTNRTRRKVCPNR